MAWRLALALGQLRTQIDQRYPGRSKESDGTIAGSEHHVANPNSDHEPWVKDGNVGVVTALDITHDPAHGVDTYTLAEHLRLVKDPRIKYVISNRKIFSSVVKPWQWRPYHGTNPHDEHIHTSVLPDKVAYDSTREWNIGDKMPDQDVPFNPVPRTVRLGSRGDEVRMLQGLIGVNVDGVFGVKTEDAVKSFQKAHGLIEDGVVGPYTWRELKKIHVSDVHKGITATVFGGNVDGMHERSAYDDHIIGEEELCVALPFRFTGTRPRVVVSNPANGKAATATIEDVGPWNTDDPYWEDPGRRPQAESGIDMRGRRTNKAGIDLSPALARALGINGSGLVDWHLI